MTGTFKIIGLAGLFAAIFLMMGCQGDDVSQKGQVGTASHPKHSGKLIITGSSTLAPMVSAIAKRFNHQHTDVQIEIQTGGSVRGINDVRQEISDIGMVARSLGNKESDLQGFPIARDGVCLVVNKDNPIETLSARQVVEIYTGSVTNWKDVGGRENPITVISRSEGRAVIELFTHYFRIKDADIKAQMVMGDNTEAIKAVVDNPDGIVPVSVGRAERDASAGEPIKLLSVDGVIATSRKCTHRKFPDLASAHIGNQGPTHGIDTGVHRFCAVFTGVGHCPDIRLRPVRGLIVE